MRQGTRLIFLNCPLRPPSHYPSYTQAAKRIESVMRLAARFDIACITIEFASNPGHWAPPSAGRIVCRTDDFDTTLMQEPIGASASVQHVALCGFEAHVSVLHTALGLLRHGRKVAVVADAVEASNSQDKVLALDRMARVGVDIVSAEMLAFEWARSFDASTCRAIMEELSPRPAPACQSGTPQSHPPLQLAALSTSSHIGDQIRRMRRERGLTLTDLGRLAACSLPHLSKIENNKGSPSLSLLIQISAAMGVDVQHFFNSLSAESPLEERANLTGTRCRKEGDKGNHPSR